MKIQDIADRLQHTQMKLDSAGSETKAKLDLDIVLLLLSKAVHQSATAASTPVCDSAARSAEKLFGLCEQLEAMMRVESIPEHMIEQITTVATATLTQAGLNMRTISQCACRCFRASQ